MPSGALGGRYPKGVLFVTYSLLISKRSTPPRLDQVSKFPPSLPLPRGRVHPAGSEASEATRLAALTMAIMACNTACAFGMED